MRRALLLCLLLAACQNYDVTVNDRQVMAPCGRSMTSRLRIRLCSAA